MIRVQIAVPMTGDHGTYAAGSVVTLPDEIARQIVNNQHGLLVDPADRATIVTLNNAASKPMEVSPAPVDPPSTAVTEPVTPTPADPAAQGAAKATAKAAKDAAKAAAKAAQNGTAPTTTPSEPDPAEWTTDEKAGS